MATNTAASSTTHTGNGTAGPFSLSFNYLDEDEIDVTVDGALKTLTTHYTFPSASTISFTSGNHPTNGAAIKFQRDTNISSKKVDFQDGSVLTEADLDNNTNQILYGLQEFVDLINDGVVRRDGTLPMTGDLQMDVGRSIIFEAATADAHETKLSVADATADRTVTLPNTTGTVVTTGDTGTVTSTMLADGTIATGDIANNSVTTAKIVDDAVTGAKIADNAITSAHIADGTVVAADIGANAVTASELADDAVDTAAIANSAVTNAKLGADAVNGSKIADDSINSEHYVDGSIDTAHIADSQITAAKLASNAVTTAKINADAVDGTKIADDSINSEHYVDGSIDTAHIADSQVTTAKLADDAVTAAKIADGSITSAHIAADTVVAADIAANAITASELADNAVDTAAIADNAVTNAKMADDSVTASEIAANAVGASELADNAVDTAAIAADAVTGAKIADDAINSEHYTDGSIDTAHIADAQITTAKLADDAVTAAKVGTFNLADLTNVHTATPNDGQVLKWVNSNSRWEPAADAQGSVTDGDYGEITVSSSGSAFTIDNGVVTTAKIADDAITGAKLSNNLDIPDSNKIRFGTGNDLEIYHDGSHSYIADTGTGRLHINTSELRVNNAADNEILISATENGAVELYHDGSLQFKTASYGLDFADNKRADFGTGNDLLIYHDGSNSYLTNSTGALILQTGNLQIKNAAGNESLIRATADGNAELYYDNSKKLETTSGGATVTGDITISDASPSIIFTDTSENPDFKIKVNSGGFEIIQETDDEVCLKAVGNGAVELYYDGVKKFETYSLGVNTNDSNIFINGDNGKFVCGAGSDLQIYHDGSNSIINNTTGHLDFQVDGSKKMRLSDGGDLQFDDNRKIELGTGQDLQIYHNGSLNIIENLSHDLSIRMGGSENSIVGRQNGAAELYYDNGKVFETTASGAKVSGILECTSHVKLGDSDVFVAGAGDDLQIFHDGSESHVYDAGTGSLRLRSNAFKVMNAANDEAMIYANENGAVELYYDNSKKLETTSAGVTVTGSLTETSDIALKHNINTIQNPLDLIEQIRGINFTWKTNGMKSMGVIAQDVEKVFPELVHGNEGSKSLQYSGLIGALVESVKELSAKVAALESA